MAIINVIKLTLDIVFVAIVCLKMTSSSLVLAQEYLFEDVIHHAQSNGIHKYIYNRSIDQLTTNSSTRPTSAPPTDLHINVTTNLLDLGVGQIEETTNESPLVLLTEIVTFENGPISQPAPLAVSKTSTVNKIIPVSTVRTVTREMSDVMSITKVSLASTITQSYPDHILKLSTALQFNDLKQLQKSYNHLDKFGYLTHVQHYLAQRRKLLRRKRRQTSDGNRRFDNSIADLFRWSLKFYQKFMGLSVTGQLDRSTTEHMQKPRCGDRDLGLEKQHQKQMQAQNKLRRYKRYALSGSRWKKSTGVLNFCISRYPQRAIDTNQTELVLFEVGRAFQNWAKYLPLQMKPMNCVDKDGHRVRKPKVDIRFEVGEHGDGDPFDGPGGVLAHAYYPLFGGDLHFDEEERWTNTQIGSNLYVVSLHEIGHVLGLDHSEITSSIMAPVYPEYRPDIALTADDVVGLHAIYDQ